MNPHEALADHVPLLPAETWVGPDIVAVRPTLISPFCIVIVSSWNIIFAVIEPVPLVFATKLHGLEPGVDCCVMLELQLHVIVASDGTCDIEYELPLAQRIEEPESVY